MSSGAFVSSARLLSLAVLAVAAVSAELARLHSGRVMLRRDAEYAATIQWVINASKRAHESSAEGAGAPACDASTLALAVGSRDFDYIADQSAEAFAGWWLVADREDTPRIAVRESEHCVRGMAVPIWTFAFVDPEGRSEIFAGAGETRPIPSEPPAFGEDARLLVIELPASPGEERETLFLYDLPPEHETDRGVRWRARIPSSRLDSRESLSRMCEGRRSDGATVTVFRYGHPEDPLARPLLARARVPGENPRLTPFFSLLDERPEKELRKLARIHGVEGDPTQDKQLAQIIARVARGLYGVELSFGLPGGFVRFTSETAIWILALTELVLLLTLSNRLTKLESASKRDTPWLVLDATRGPERALAVAWLWGVLAAPWLTVFALTLTASDRIAALDTSAGAALVTLAAILALFAVSTWTAVDVCLRIDHLRGSLPASLEDETPDGAPDPYGPPDP